MIFTKKKPRTEFEDSSVFINSKPETLSAENVEIMVQIKLQLRSTTFES